jgi:hypothetical protein
VRLPLDFDEAGVVRAFLKADRQQIVRGQSTVAAILPG